MGVGVAVAILASIEGLRSSGPEPSAAVSARASSSIRTAARSLSAEDRARLRKRDPKAVRDAAQQWHEELLERYPQFQVDFKEVPDEENGFLQFLALLDEFGGTSANLPMPGELREMLTGKLVWNSEMMVEWLSQNEELFGRLLAIAEAPGQSVKGIDMERYQFIGARFPREISLVLRGAARVVAERDSADQALPLYKATMNFANHFDQFEVRSLLGKTVGTLIRLESQGDFRESILPEIAGDANALGRWREALAHLDSVEAEWPTLMAGEWNLMSRTLLLPAVITGDWPGMSESGNFTVPDPEALLHAYSMALTDEMNKARSKAASQLFQEGTMGFGAPEDISPASGRVMEALGAGSHAWMKGFATSITRMAMHDAMIAVLLGEPVPSEPNTGLPFVWDADARTLSPPPEALALGLQVDPMAVP